MSNLTKQQVIDTYGQGPAFEIKDKLDKVYFTNVAGVKWFFEKYSEYKELKRKIADNRKARR